MLLSTSQLVCSHGLKDQNLNLEISNCRLERVSEAKLLGVKLQENLKWNDHVKDIANASYGVFRTLPKLKLSTEFPYIRDLQSRLYFQGWTIVTQSTHLCQGTC